MRKLTTQEFIQKAKQVHNKVFENLDGALDCYDYSKVEYKNSTTKVTIICPIHGEFQQTPGNHLSGKGCPECAKLNRSKSRKNSIKTTLDFIKKATDIHNNFYKYDKSVYTKRANKLIITCPIHGDFEQIAGDHLGGHGCPKCKSDKAKLNTDSKEQFVEKAKKIHGIKYDYSKVNYINSQTKVCIICPEHGEFWQRPNSHISMKTGCPQCYLESKNLTQEQFLDLAYKVHKNRYDYSKAKYVNTKTKIEIICSKHGSFWQSPNVHLSAKCGCPQCSISKGEELIIHLFEDYNVKYIYNYKIDIDKNINHYGYALIDFYLPEYNIAIEYNGKQHYISNEYFGGELNFERQLKRDNCVRDYCKDNNIKLIEIKYDMKEAEIKNLIGNILGV